VRRILLAALAFLAFGSAACRTLQTDEDMSDPAVKARIEAILRGRKDLDLKYVTVDVNTGVATLSGIVPNSAQLRVIRNLAMNVRGVDQVLNNLVVQE
jgi:osmotically-inducible protein OsmY